MSFKDVLFCCFVIVIFRPVYSQDVEPQELRKSELACQKYQHFNKDLFTAPGRCFGNNMLYHNRIERNEFPHMVAIGYDNENATDYDFICSGSLISDKFVLTAAHCVNKRNLVPRIVRLGKTTNSKSDCNDAVLVNVIFDHKKIHNDYNSRTKHNDIALLELEKSVEQFYSFSLFPACLHQGFDLISELIVIGWRYENFSEERTYNNWMQKANLQEIPIATCKDKLKKIPRINITESQLCATTENEVVVCLNESGSPLQYKLNGMYYVAGVAISRVSCEIKYPTINTRVSSYIDWIENIVWPK